MEQNVARLSLFEQLWAWFETNKKQAAWAAGAVVVIAFIVAFYIWRKGETEVQAGEALSEAGASMQAEGRRQVESADDYLKVAANYPGTGAASRALLQAASVLFAQGQYPEAMAQFQRFTREFADSPFLPQALLGVASCLDAQGKIADAMQAYDSVAKRFPSSNVAPQAEFALARIYESQDKPEQAWVLFEKVARQLGLNSSIGSEAGIRAEELKAKLPASVTTPPATPNTGLNTAPPDTLILTTNHP